jgi:hypothetical protein
VASSQVKLSAATTAYRETNQDLATLRRQKQQQVIVASPIPDSAVNQKLEQELAKTRKLLDVAVASKRQYKMQLREELIKAKKRKASGLPKLTSRSKRTARPELGGSKW